ncbi:MAG TPA: prepilin-type N-terminal cleavage/methylation domain-containing protein [Tepidisphaeraceae bacterium]|jgi:prepilin-type N-terminal cleavage/methylation domain-containing protein|nr:prepilin-type N-terminal cleavage/methylation domain-containing protein [Tepidisphaeraceae bacterium]
MIQQSRKAFTLVELLVVIGIIALLISILLPAMSRARQQAVSVQCMSQLKQIGNASLMYAGENRGWLPPGEGGFARLELFLDWGDGAPGQYSVREAMARLLGVPNWQVTATNPPHTPFMFCPADNQGLASGSTYVLVDDNNFLLKGGLGGKFYYWWVGNPTAPSVALSGGNADVPAATYFIDIDGDGATRTGVEYLRKVSDRHSSDVAICTDRSKQAKETGGWYYMHGNSSKPSTAWKNELFGDGHCDRRLASDPKATTWGPDVVRPRWYSASPAAW